MEKRKITALMAAAVIAASLCGCATVISCASTAMQGGPGNMPGNKPEGDMQTPPGGAQPPDKLTM